MGNVMSNSSFRPFGEVYERKRVAPGTRYEVMDRDDWTCQYCGDHATELDHIIPVAHGGENKPKNLVASCRDCNVHIQDRVFEDFTAKKRTILIERFNPEGRLGPAEEEALVGDA
jgi:5-methylcytosine-specific restriction endonuclease McrA